MAPVGFRGAQPGSAAPPFLGVADGGAVGQLVMVKLLPVEVDGFAVHNNLVRCMTLS